MSDRTKEAMKQLTQLQQWRNQLMGLGLLPPDLQALIKEVDEHDGIMAALNAEKASVGVELEKLKGSKRELESLARKYQTAFEETCRKIDTKRVEKEAELTLVGQQIAAAREELNLLKTETDTHLKDRQSALAKVQKEHDRVQAVLADTRKRLGV